MNKRPGYFLVLLIIILLGIMSRQFAGIPLFIGDFLYAVMVYFGCRMVFTNLKLKHSALISLLACWTIEAAQCFQADWLIAIRQTKLGHYAFGQGFLWSDLLAYLAGIAAAFFIDALFWRRIA